MQQVSQAYKALMKEKWINGLCHMRVTIGVINQEAQSAIKVANQADCEYYSNFYKPLNNYTVKEKELYAACDEQYTKLDGSMYFLPREKEAAVLNQGIVTEALRGVIEFGFSKPYDIKGLTIEFGDSYPVDFLIESTDRTVEISGNDQKHFTTDEVFEGTTYIKIIPSKMVHGECRLRIHQITMGIGIYFTDHEIASATKQEYINPVSEELPTVDFRLTVRNNDRQFDIENDESSANFLEVGQIIEALYGQDLPDGTTEWIPGISLILTDWEVDDDEMSFSAADRFTQLNETYYRGLYREEGITLYDLALDVIQNAGIDMRDIWLDPYLKDVTVNNPMPVVTHKEALQLIANAGRCVLYQGRTGKIFLKSSFRADLTVSADDTEYYGDVLSSLSGTRKTEYASGSLHFTEVDAGVLFLPRQESGNTYVDTGYISEQVSDENGLFQENPKITISAEAAYKCFGVTLEFGRVYPQAFKLTLYYEGEVVEEYSVEETQQRTVINHEFAEWDRLELEFTKGAPHSRVFLYNLTFGDDTDYMLEYSRDLTGSPKGKQLSKVKEVQVVRLLYSKGQEADVELARETITVTAADNQYTLYFSNPAYGLSCALSQPQAGQSVKIIDSSSYYATVQLSGVTGSAEVSITGREYIPSYAKVTRQLHPSGSYETWENPLVSDVVHAANLADWIGDYLKYDKEYEISYRGDPRIDGNDLFYLESRYVKDMKIRAYQHNLEFNGGLSGTITARRVE